MLLRNRLRDEAVSLLIAANTAAGGNVFATRAIPLDARREPPAILVYSPADEGALVANAGPPQFMTVVTMAILAIVSGSDEAQCGVDLDALCEPIPEVLLTAPSWVAMADEHGRVLIRSIPSLHRDTSVKLEGDRFVGRGLIRIGVQYLDRYTPRLCQPLTEITVTAQNDPGVSADITIAQD